MVKRIAVANYPIEDLSVATDKGLIAFLITVAEAENAQYIHKVYLFDLTSNRIVNQFNYQEPGTILVSSLKLNEDGTYLAISANRYGPASLWRVNDGIRLFDIQTNPNTDLFTQFDFSSDGAIFAVTNEHRDNEDNIVPVVEIRETKTGKLLNVLKGSAETYATVAISKDMQYIAAATGFGVFFQGSAVVDIWDLKTGQLLHTLIGHTDRIIKLLFSADDKSIITAGSDTDTTVRMWQLDSGSLSGVIDTQIPVQDIAINHSGDLLASIAKDGAIRIWNLATKQEIVKLKNNTLVIADDDLENVTFSPDGTMLIVSESTGNIQIWNLHP